jgi:hypothetical protein
MNEPDGALPRFVADALATVLDGPPPRESRATCSDCAMCSAPGEPAAEPAFDPRVKCCTQTPELANHIVGRILSDDDPEGRASVLRRIAAGAATPLGLGRTRAEEAGEVSGDARCPHLVDSEEGARCGIHRHRSSSCATWFCKHDRGETGRAFWAAAHRFLSSVENGLARHCLLALNVDPEDWGPWRGRESDFYRACATEAAGVNRPELLSLGPEVRIAARLLDRAARQLAPAPLPPLRVAPLRVRGVFGDVCRVESYSRYDGLDLSTLILQLLRYFDGREVGEVLRDIAAREEVEVEEELVRMLLDFRILVPAQ